MRTGVVAVALALFVLAPLLPRPASAQFSFDARRYGMGGVSLSRDGNVRRYNPAYRAVKNRSNLTGNPKFSIPIPFGLIDFIKNHPLNQLGSDPMFDPKSTAFNPVALMNVILNPPIFYEIKKPPEPTNNVELTIGKNQLIVDLGGSQVLIPEQKFGSYSVLIDAVAQAGFAPTVGFAGRLTHCPDPATDDGFYLGAALHYYLGATYGRGTGPAGFTVGDTIFKSTPTILVNDTLRTSNKANGHGVGGDVGFAWISGPFEVGLGVNDIGAELTWSDTKVQQIQYFTAGDSLRSSLIGNHVESKTKLPITYVANAALRMGTGTTVGGDVVNSGRGTVIHVGAEQRVGPWAVRGGVSRDQRKRMQFGVGAGLRLGPLGLDVGLFTHGNSLSSQRAVTMATAISIY